MTATSNVLRCAWAMSDPLMRGYHDTEWGVPLHDDRALFEFLCLEGAQAGLSWRTVLTKRDNYRKAFHDFEIARLAAMTDRDLEKRLLDPGIIRNRLKISSTRSNAVAALGVINEFGSLDAYLWSFVGRKPQRNRWREPSDIPVSTEVSDRMSKALKKRGFRFVGTTICYSLMQTTGMINDHLVDCFRHKACAEKHCVKWALLHCHARTDSKPWRESTFPIAPDEWVPVPGSTPDHQTIGRHEELSSRAYAVCINRRCRTEARPCGPSGS